jgi:hypothetical protein
VLADVDVRVGGGATDAVVADDAGGPARERRDSGTQPPAPRSALDGPWERLIDARAVCRGAR